MASVRLLIIQGGFHVLILIVTMPGLLLAASAAIGTALAEAEGWETLEGILYVGGNLVLLPLTDVVPASTLGTAIDIVVSILMAGALGWGLAIVGLMPFCDKTHSTLHAAHRPIHKEKRPILASMVSVILFVVFVIPLGCIAVSAVIAFVLEWAEDWTYGNSFLRCLGVFSHLPTLAPKAQHPASDEGKIVILLNALVGVIFSVGWPVGVFLLLPALGNIAGFLNKVSITRSEGFVAKCINYCLVVLIFVPLVLLPMSLALGFVLSEAEGWGSITTGAMYVGGNLVGIPLASASVAVAPVTASGKTLDFVVSFVGIGCLGFLIAALGAMDFTDKCCEALGGKADGRLAAVKFTVLFYVCVVPMTCAACAVPMGGALAALESWSFQDGWFFAMSVLGQAPSLAPAGLAVSSDVGKLGVFMIACYSLCVTIGWGAGLVVASKALDNIGDGIAGTIEKLKAAVGIDDGVRAAGTDAASGDTSEIISI
mmetsp:Transcript_114041/g.323444  ORF Transcript_114041/g.323444 Transcript_114041/m.323444 type:complete len:484 (-) Transcript_114041:567-2018(-)